MDDFLKKMAHLRSDFRDVQQQIDAKVDNILEMLASMQQHLQMQEMSNGKEVEVSLCRAEIHSQHQIVTSATSSEEAESGAKVHLGNLELVFEKPYENAKLQSCSEKPVLMCAQQVFDEISKLEKLEIVDAPLLTCEHKFDKVPESTLIVSNYANVVRKVDAHVCPLGVLDLTEVIEKIVAPLENFQSIEVSLNRKMIEREETKLKIGDDKNEVDHGLLNETRNWMGSVLGKPVVVICFSRGKGVIMFYELRVFDYLTDKKFDPGGDAILEVAGSYKMSTYYGCDGSVQGIFHPFPFYRSSYQSYDGCRQLKAEEKEGKLEFSNYRVKDWHWQQEGMSNTMRRIWKRKRIKILCIESVAIQPSSPNCSYDSLQPSINSKRVDHKIHEVDKRTSILCESLAIVEPIVLCRNILLHVRAWKQMIKLPTLGKGQMSNHYDYLVIDEDHRLCIETELIEEVTGMRFRLYFIGIFLGVRLQLFASKFDGYAGENNSQFPELVDFFCEYYSYFNHNKASSPTLKTASPTTAIIKFLRLAIITVPCFMMCLMLLRILELLCKNDVYYLILMKNDQVHQLYLCGGIVPILSERKGNKLLGVASDGFPGIFSDFNWNTYFVAMLTCLHSVHVWCDVRLTEDGSGIIVDKLKSEYKVEANAGASQINYRASISKVIEVKFVHKKQSSPPNQYFTNLLLEINARLDGVSSIIAMIVVGVGTVSSSVPTGNKEISVSMFDRPLPKPPPQFRYLSREDTTRSRGKYCYGNGRVRCGDLGDVELSLKQKVGIGKPLDWAVLLGLLSFILVVVFWPKF